MQLATMLTVPRVEALELTLYPEILPPFTINMPVSEISDVVRNFMSTQHGMLTTVSSVESENNGSHTSTSETMSPPSKKSRLTSDPDEEKAVDREYFQSYGGMDIHEVMLQDKVRTLAYRDALQSKTSELEGKPLLDVGCGSGILSLFAWQSGARPVFAVEASQVAAAAQKLVDTNGAGNTVKVIRKRIEAVNEDDVDICKANSMKAIVSEWMGHCLLYENMLPSVIWARDHWLQKNGLLFPHEAVVHVAAYSADDLITHRREMRQELSNIYGVELSSIWSDVPPMLDTKKIHVLGVSMEEIVSKSSPVMLLDLYKITTEDLKCVQGDFKLPIIGGVDSCGLCIWFHVTFPDGSILCTGPYDTPTHWQQSVVLFENGSWPTRQGHLIRGNMKLINSHEGRHKRYLQMALRCEMVAEADENVVLNVTEQVFEMTD